MKRTNAEAQKETRPAQIQKVLVNTTGATVGAQLWQMADALRGERLREDKRWKYGVPPRGNANFAWVQHIVHHLAPAGTAGFVLANGSMSSNQSGEGEIRKNIVEADLVDCMVALPGQLFYSTQIPACLWFLARDKRSLPSPTGRGAGGEGRDRRGQVLFIDARKMGRMVDRTHRELTDEDIRKISRTYHAWRLPAPQSAAARQAGGEKDAGAYADAPGFCKSATLEAMRDRLIAIRDKLPVPEDLAERLIADEEIEDELLDEMLDSPPQPSDDEGSEEQPKAAEVEPAEPAVDRQKLLAEIDELNRYVQWARSIGIDTKTRSLIKALEIGFAKMTEMGAAQRAATMIPTGGM